MYAGQTFLLGSNPPLVAGAKLPFCLEAVGNHPMSTTLRQCHYIHTKNDRNRKTQIVHLGLKVAIFHIFLVFEWFKLVIT